MPGDESNLDYIVPQLRPLAIEVGALSLDPDNAREHNQRSIDAVKASLGAFKQRKPIVVRREPETGLLVAVEAGNGTLMAARELGWSHVAAVIVEETEARGKAYALADNRTAEHSKWGPNAPDVLDEVKVEFPDIDFDAMGLDDDWTDSIEIPDLDDGGEEEDAGDGDTPTGEPPPLPDNADDVPDLDDTKPPETQPGQKISIGRHELHCDDCLDVMRALPDASIDAIVTDPPYGLSPDKRARTWDDIEALRAAGKSGPKGGLIGKAWDAGVPGITWARECLRVLKPGGHIIAFSANRTIHRVTVSLEDAGFEIRDQINWLTWQGFPHGLDLAIAFDKDNEAMGHRSKRFRAMVGQEDLPTTGPIDAHDPITAEAKAWAGWNTVLKPCAEPAVLARKPISEPSIIENVRKHGTGALNIDACRYRGDDPAWPGPKDEFDLPARNVSSPNQPHTTHAGMGAARKPASSTKGRYPSNVYHCPKPSVAERDAGLEDQPKRAAGSLQGSFDGSLGSSAKPTAARANFHPTVKPTKLMRWLLRLVSPPGGVVLEPFGGSGSTLVAAHGLDLRIIAVERDPAYCDLIRARAQAVGHDPRDGEG